MVVLREKGFAKTVIISQLEVAGKSVSAHGARNVQEAFVLLRSSSYTRSRVR